MADFFGREGGTIHARAPESSIGGRRGLTVPSHARVSNDGRKHGERARAGSPSGESLRIAGSMDLISTTAALRDACDRLAAQSFVTVDTEFMRETT